MRVPPFTVAAVAVAAATVVAPRQGGAARAAQDTTAPCRAALAQRGGVADALGALSQYRTTYVLAFVDRPELAEGLSSPALHGLHVGVHVGAAETLADEAGLTRLRRYPVPPDDPGVPVADLLAGNLEAALLWAPLAGLALLERDPDYRVSLVAVAGPRPAPTVFPQADAGDGACAQAVETLLAAYGVVNAEVLARVDIEQFLGRRAPAPGRGEEEKQGGDLFARHCAQCHGEQAVAAPESLAPVELRRSVRRFTYPGFLYIVLNGRPSRGHPGFRGKLRESQIERIYQYLRARSSGALPASGRTVP